MIETSVLKEICRCIEVLEYLVQHPALIAELSEEQRVALMAAAGRISRPAKDEIRVRNNNINRARRQKIVAADRRARAATGIREARLSPVFVAPQALLNPAPDAGVASASPQLQSPRNCYVCKAEYVHLHHFYDSMCSGCAEFNYKKRFQTASLHGQVAVITGARLKIGYHSALMMLRAGARVIVTTRFPVDAASRFAREADCCEWLDRLEVHGLDLRHTPSVEIFTRFLEQHLNRLDILINNAAQTVRRPPGFYEHLLAREHHDVAQLEPAVQKILAAHQTCKDRLSALGGTTQAALAALPVSWHNHVPGIGLRASAQLSQIPYSYDSSLSPEEVFPLGLLDADLQQVDLRATNSWRLKLADVPTPEMLEVQLVNAVAPFVLCSRLTPLMRRENTGKKHIVNVTAMEGKFHRFTKSERHPHTNMAKAALNMLTHTSASDLVQDGIFMNAVDTGWVTDEDPAALAQRKTEVHDFQPPLDIVDGAARVCDPFFDGILTGTHWCGKFLKDYFPTDW